MKSSRQTPVTADRMNNGLPQRTSIEKASRGIYAIYTDGSAFSGSQIAAEIVLATLEQRGRRTNRILLPAVDRSGNRSGMARYVHFVSKLCQSWLNSLIGMVRPAHVYLSLGQTIVSIARASVPFFLLTQWNGKSVTVISLHGSLFMHWKPKQIEARLLRLFVSRADYVTVLGPSQQRQLHYLGIPLQKTHVLLNTSPVEPLPQALLARKFATLTQKFEPIRLLFLGSLIASKGYPGYLKSLELLSQQSDLPPIKACLCGPLHDSDFDDYFANSEEARAWINGMIATINRSTNLSVQWLQGARGTAKQKLLRETHLFVFPSDYAVEAQPLVLLEAMASGCAIVTSNRGEIPFTMSGCGIVLNDLTPKHVAQAIENLVVDVELMKNHAYKLHRLYQMQYSYELHGDAWERLFPPDR